MKEELINLTKGTVIGYCIDLGNAPLLIIQAKKGYVMCGYLNMQAANKLGDIAGKVTGVKTFQEVLNAKIMEVSEKAKQAGLTEGMQTRTFLNELL